MAVGLASYTSRRAFARMDRQECPSPKRSLEKIRKKKEPASRRWGIKQTGSAIQLMGLRHDPISLPNSV